MCYSLELLGDIFTKKKLSIVDKNTQNSFTNEQVLKVLNGEILNPKKLEDKAKDNTAINLSTKSLLKMQEIYLEDLEGKKIFDIGGGFTGLPFLLNGLEAQVNIVDPIFLNPINNEIKRNKDKIFGLISDFDEKNYKYFVEGDTKKQEYCYVLNEQFNNILSDLNNWNKEYMENTFQLGKTQVNIFPNTGEEIDFIDSGTIDYVFINHTITKAQVNPYDLLNKVYDLLKVGGKIYITESGEFDFSIFKLFNEEFDIKVINSSVLDNYNKKTILILQKK